MVTHQVGQLAHRRRQVAGLAGVSVGIGALASVVRSASSDTFFGKVHPTPFIVAIAVFGVLAALTAFYAWRISTLEQALKLEIEDAADTLGDNATLMETLDEIGLDDSWTRAGLREAVGRWCDSERPARASFRAPAVGEPLRATAARIGPVDFARLLTANRVEAGLIVEEDLTAESGSPTFGFRLQRPTRRNPPARSEQ